MRIEYDLVKDAANITKHGVSLSQTSDLDILAAIENSREEDGERRFRLYGLIDGEAFCAIVTFRSDRVRVISLRRANRSERKQYDLRKEER